MVACSACQFEPAVWFCGNYVFCTACVATIDFLDADDEELLDDDGDE